MKKGDVKIGTNGDTYVLVKRIGRGGQAEVWKAQNKKTKVYYAYKEYKHNTNNIKANIDDLIKIERFKDKNGKVLDDIVLPITIVECGGDSFGYIMELIDLKDFTVVKKAWCGKYPSCEAICKIVQNFARVFETLHLSYGMCYKDVNEGNVFFNPSTGNIKIIDNDNIGYATKKTIGGTPGYRAPEVVLGALPDHNSDRFSFAVFVFRLLTGGFPFDGPYTEKYCAKNDLTVYDAEKVVYGTKALFVWHPTNRQNSIEQSTDSQKKGQVEYWNKLPDSVKDMFISTFATNLSKDRRAERTTDVDWRDTFYEIEQNLLECPHCGKITFSEAGICFECSGKLKVNVHKHRVVFKVLSAGERKKEIETFVADVMQAKDVSKNLPSGELFKVLYNKKEQKVGIKNLSSLAWTVIYVDKTKVECRPRQVAVLETGMMIRIIPKIVQLNVVDLI